MGLLTSASQAFEGVGIALDSLRSNKVRAALTIMGVALGVFVVVAMSSVVRGINESFRRDLEASGPTSFFIYRRPIGGFGPPPEETRNNPGITMDEVRTLERLPDIKAVTAHVGMGSSFKYRDRTIRNAGMEVYTPNWTEIDGGDIYPGRSFTYAENYKAERVALVNDKMSSSSSARRSRSTRSCASTTSSSASSACITTRPARWGPRLPADRATRRRRSSPTRRDGDTSTCGCAGRTSS
jgi:putative ABC transport system permease protein